MAYSVRIDSWRHSWDEVNLRVNLRSISRANRNTWILGISNSNLLSKIFWIVIAGHFQSLRYRFYRADLERTRMILLQLRPQIISNAVVYQEYMSAIQNFNSLYTQYQLVINPDGTVVLPPPIPAATVVRVPIATPHHTQPSIFSRVGTFVNSIPSGMRFRTSSHHSQNLQGRVSTNNRRIPINNIGPAFVGVSTGVPAVSNYPTSHSFRAPVPSVNNHSHPPTHQALNFAVSSHRGAIVSSPARALPKERPSISNSPFRR